MNIEGWYVAIILPASMIFTANLRGVAHSVPWYTAMATTKQDISTTATTKLILSSYQPSDANHTISPHLKELVLHDSSSSMTDEEVDILCRKILMKRSYLERLTLDLRECSDEGMRHIAELIEKTKTLKWVSLLLNNVSELGALYLAEVIKSSQLEGFSIYATQLDLHDRCIGDKGTEHLARVLEHNTSLKSLCIGQSGVTNVGLGCILRTLSNTESKSCITNLDLHSNLIDTDGAAAIAAFLVSVTTTVKLKRLILDENHHIGNEGAREIALALCHNSSLEMLSMRSCSIGSQGGARFATTLNKNRSLKKLDLRGNVDIGDSAVELLARGLKENSCLRKLDLSSCGVGDEGCAGLADALLTNETLTHLKLHRNDISDGGLMALSEALTRNSSLTTLVLTENRFGDKGAQSLVSTLHQNSSLTVLTVDTSLISQGSRGEVVRAMLEKNKELLRYKKKVKELQEEVEKLTKERDHYCEQLKLK